MARARTSGPKNGVMSLLATEYVKYEILGMTLMDELGEDWY